MKKIFSIIFILMFSACSTQVTVTSEVIVTSPPTETIPVITPTLYVEPTIFQEAHATTIVNGLEIVLGEVDENGNSQVTEFVSPEDMNEANVANWLEQFDETRLGLAGDWVATTDGRVVLLDDINDPTSVLAEHKIFEQTGTMQVVVDGSKLVENGENAILSAAETDEWRGGLPLNYEEVFDLNQKIIGEVLPDLKALLLAQGYVVGHAGVPAGYILSSDGKRGVSIRYIVFQVDGGAAMSDIARSSTEGVVLFRNVEGGHTYFFVENFHLEYID